MWVCMCVREIRKYMYVAGCRLCLCLCLCLYYFMCTGPDHARLSLSSAVCQTVCADAYCFGVCSCVSEIQRGLRCGPCPCVYAYRLVLCASIPSLSVSVCVTAAVTGVPCSLLRGVSTLAQPKEQQDWQ
jgi:hypothetical protein